MRTHHHDHPTDKTQALLGLSFWLTAAIFVGEVWVGYWTNSVALLSDAGHAFMDLAALFFSLLALKLSQRPVTHQQTYGLHRLEVFAAFLNGVFVVGVAAWIVFESVRRLHTPPDVRTGPMLAMAVTGLAVNVYVALRLKALAHSDINIRGAFVHVLSDALASVGVVAGGVIIYFTGNLIVDPLVGLFVAAIIVVNAVRLLVDSTHILLEGTPAHLKLADIIRDIEALKGVVRVEDAHVWSICSHFISFSCHVVVDPAGLDRQADILQSSDDILHNRYHITHSTIEIHSSAWNTRSIQTA